MREGACRLQIGRQTGLCAENADEGEGTTICLWGLSPETPIERKMKAIREVGQVRRVGVAKNGHWEVNE